MPIELVCPNGHKLKAPEDRAGKAGKCPKCGVDFIVPPLEHDEPAEDFAELPGSESSGSDGAEPAAGTPVGAAVAEEAKSSGSGKQAALAAATREQTITFLCPNGHKLNSPASLQGKAGKCPHCGERFRVPMLDDVDEFAEEEVEEFGVDEPAGEFLDAGAYDEPFEEEIPEDAVEEDFGPPHPTRRIFERLWREREHGGKVRVLLAEGPPVEADFYARRWSQGPHAVVASRDEGGNYRIAAIAWDAVRKVEVDELVNLPEDVFE